MGGGGLVVPEDWPDVWKFKSGRVGKGLGEKTIVDLNLPPFRGNWLSTKHFHSSLNLIDTVFESIIIL